MRIGEQVKTDNNHEFNNNDIVIDVDGLPWRFYDGRWTSIWSVNNANFLAKELNEDDIIINRHGLTSEQLFVAKQGYGPYVFIWNGLN